MDNVDTLVRMGRAIAHDMGDVSPTFFRFWAKYYQQNLLPRAMKLLEVMMSSPSISDEYRYYAGRCLMVLRRHETILRNMESKAASWVLGYAYRELCALNPESETEG